MMNKGNVTLWVIISLVIVALVVGGVMFFGNQTKEVDSKDLPAQAVASQKEDTNKNMNTVILKTNKGDITIELFRDLTPNTAENFEELAKSGFYNGTRFHRVIQNFMIQGGDPQSKDLALKDRWGTGGPGYQFADEIGPENNNARGTISMANSGPNTNGSQFFINTVDNTGLNPKHTVFGRVVSGMDVVDAIEATETGARDVPLEDMIIESVEVK